MEAAVDSPSTGSRSWSATVWISFGVLLFAFQIVLVVFLSRPPALIPTASPPIRSFRFITDAPQGELISKQLYLLNPALFGAPNAHGFSGMAWIRNPDPDVGIGSWSEPPAYLELSNRMPRPAGSFNESEDFIRNPFAEKLWPPLAEPQISTTVPLSTLKLDGTPGNRPLVNIAPLPVQAYTDVLSNSVVQAAVDSHGAVISARLISRSGSRKADMDALGIARLARFEPRIIQATSSKQITELDWAILTFQWFTVEPEPAELRK